MKKGIVVLLALALAAFGAWYYLVNVHSVAIGKIVASPRDYAGKEVAVTGVVTERFSFLVVKWFDLRDETGNISVVTQRALPRTGERVRVTGKVREGFSLGERQAVVLVENRQ